MAERSRSSFQSEYNTSSAGAFKDNTTKFITAGTMRTFSDDISESHAMFEDLKPITASGTNTYTLASSPTLTSYSNGRLFLVLFTNANTGAATLNIDSLGAKAITKNGANALEGGDIGAGSIKLLSYDGTQFQIVSGERTIVMSSNLYINGTVGASPASNQNNFNPSSWVTTASVLLITPTANINITGIVAPAVLGKFGYLFNMDTTYTFTLKHQDASSSLANRFDIGADLAIGPGKSCQIWYDGSFWRVASAYV